MSKKKELDETVQYVGEYEIFIPSLNKKVKPGDIVEGFPIDEARVRTDFKINKTISEGE